MEIDTGAVVSIISKDQQESDFPNLTLKPSHGPASHGGCRARPGLLGRNWMHHLQFDWKAIGAVKAAQHPGCTLQALLSKYTKRFSETSGVRSEATLHVKAESRPKFCKVHSIPFAIKPAIDQELECLEAAGIIQKVATSNWAAPIVPVPKKDGRYRPLGTNVTPVMDVEQYRKPTGPLCHPCSGQKFTTCSCS